MEEIGRLFTSHISIEPVESPPMWEACGLYHTATPCSMLVALGFLLPARGFTPKGTSKAECRTEKLLTFGFGLWGATSGPPAPMGFSLIGEKVISPSPSEAERPPGLGFGGGELTSGVETVEVKDVDVESSSLTSVVETGGSFRVEVFSSLAKFATIPGEGDGARGRGTSAMEGGGPMLVLCSQPMMREGVAVETESFSHNFRRASALAIAFVVRGAMKDSIPSSFSIEETSNSLPIVALDEEGSSPLSAIFSGKEAGLLAVEDAEMKGSSSSVTLSSLLSDVGKAGPGGL